MIVCLGRLVTLHQYEIGLFVRPGMFEQARITVRRFMT